MEPGTPTIDPAMAAEIDRRLAGVEEADGVRILYAVESGSRAWGFPSADSDYDVRFVYVRQRDWYLSVNLESRRDVIERPILDHIDLSGWDIRKALLLFAKSNPPFLEWLSSPIVYRDELGFAAAVRELLPRYYSPVSSLYHFLRMAQGNYRDFLQGPEVIVKSTFTSCGRCWPSAGSSRGAGRCRWSFPSCWPRWKTRSCGGRSRR